MEKKRYDNHLELWGWLGGGKWGIERYLYTLHRITGVGILLFFTIHIFESSTRIFGMKTWDIIMKGMEFPLFTIGEVLVFTAFAFHALNGIRLILIELGFMVGKPEQPVYPYQSSLDVQRPMMMVIMVIVCVLVLAGGIDILFLHK